MKYKVKYEDSDGNDCILEFDSEQEAEIAINEDWNEFVNQHKSLGCFYADIGNKTECWVSGGDEYASWKRLWK